MLAKQNNKKSISRRVRDYQISIERWNLKIKDKTGYPKNKYVTKCLNFNNRCKNYMYIVFLHIVYKLCKVLSFLKKS